MNLLNYIIVIFLSIMTTIIFVSVILYSDRKSREPFHMILICMISGIFTICLTLLMGQIILPNLEIIFGLYSYNANVNIRTLVLALVEEYAKLFTLYLFISKNRNFDDIYDGFVYSSLIALSFAALETLIYVFNEPDFLSMTSLAILRGITTIPLHLICGIVMGYYVGIEKFSWGLFSRIKKLLGSLFIPTLIHFTYNYLFSVIIGNLSSDGLFIIFMIVFLIPFYIIAISYIKKTIFMNDKFINNIKYKNLMTRNEYNEIIKYKY